MSSSILFEITKLTGPAPVDELLNVFGYGHLTELYPERMEYFESLCLHLNELARRARQNHQQNTSRRIETTLQRICRIERHRLLEAA